MVCYFVVVRSLTYVAVRTLTGSRAAPGEIYRNQPVPRYTRSCTSITHAERSKWNNDLSTSVLLSRQQSAVEYIASSPPSSTRRTGQIHRTSCRTRLRYRIKNELLRIGYFVRGLSGACTECVGVGSLRLLGDWVWSTEITPDRRPHRGFSAYNWWCF